MATLVAAVSAVAIVTTLLWRRSEEQKRQAQAAGLVVLAREQLDENNTAALAYATASLELSDRPETRRLALEALWRGPTFFSIPTEAPYSVDFGRDGHWLAAGGALWPSDGGPPMRLEGSGDHFMETYIGPRSDVVAMLMDEERFTLGLWSVPQGELLRKLSFEGLTLFHFSGDGRRLITVTDIVSEQPLMDTVIRSWPLESGEPEVLARIKRARQSTNVIAGLDPTNRWLFWPDGVFLRLAPLQKGVSDPRPAVSLEHAAPVFWATFDPAGRMLATADSEGHVRVWEWDRDLSSVRELPAPDRGALELHFDSRGERLAAAAGYLWELSLPAQYEPLRLHKSGRWGGSFAPSGDWFATGSYSSPALWPLSRRFPRIIRQHTKGLSGLAFAPDGGFLVSASADGTVRTWPLPDRPARSAQILLHKQGQFSFPTALARASTGDVVAVPNLLGEVTVVPLDGTAPRSLPGFADTVGSVAIDPIGRFVAAGSGAYYSSQALVRLWDLETGETRILDAGDGEPVQSVIFTSEGTLLVSSGEKQRLWNVKDGTFRLWETGSVARGFALHPDGDQVFLRSPDGLRLARLSGPGSRPLEAYGSSVSCMSFDRTGEVVVSGDSDGAIRVGFLDDGEPHLLLGHEGEVTTLAVSPDNRWIASGGEDGTIRLWPMPDLSKPPLQALPYEELLATLHDLTNLRAVSDPGSATGYKLEIGRFPGWKGVPEW